MNAPKVSDVDYIQFLIAAQRVYTCTEAARCAEIASHDAFTRLLSRLPPDTAALWQEVEPLIDKRRGLLVVDDTTLDKPYAQKMDLVTRHYLNAERRHTVFGIIGLRHRRLATGSPEQHPINMPLTSCHESHYQREQLDFRAAAFLYLPPLLCFVW